MADRRRRILVVDADPVLARLLDEWLAALLVEVVHESPVGTVAQQDYDLAIVDLPFPRVGGAQRVARLAGRYPMLPIIAVSANFFPCTARSGALACALGVACTLPKPLSQQALVGAVRQLLRL